MAIRLAHFVHFYSGDARRMRDSAARVLPAWGRDVPGHGYVKGIYAFGLEEAGDYAAAEKWGRAAVADNPCDIWSTHAVAHVYEMQGRHHDGIAWLEELEDNWQGLNNFVFHVWWHKALYCLELERHEDVLALYDRRFRAAPSDEYLDITNAVAMLWRLEHRGVDVGGRWAELADASARRAADHLLVFADAHYVMALAHEGREADVARLLESGREASFRDGTQEHVTAAVGLTLCEAIADFEAGRPGEAFERLAPARYDVIAIGGSHAQRDLFDQLLIEAALAAGRTDEAKALLAERIRLKPRSTHSWRTYARALQMAGEDDAAAAARQRIDALLAA